VLDDGCDGAHAHLRTEHQTHGKEQQAHERQHVTVILTQLFRELVAHARHDCFNHEYLYYCERANSCMHTCVSRPSMMTMLKNSIAHKGATGK
jgi:2-polyprenyl-6-methoxyphenol hydroxylase-like FAD-dependent oxidoreductase